MDLLVLGIHGVFGEWQQMLPAASAASRPMLGRSCTAMWLPSPSPNTFRSTWVGRSLRRLAMVSPSGPISHCAAVALRETEHHSDVVLASGVGKFEGERAGLIFWPHSHCDAGVVAG